MELGETIKNLRKQKDMTTSELARQVQISQPYLSQIETGYRTKPTQNILKEIAKTLDIPSSHLIDKTKKYQKTSHESLDDFTQQLNTFEKLIKEQASTNNKQGREDKQPEIDSLKLQLISYLHKLQQELESESSQKHKKTFLSERAIDIFDLFKLNSDFYYKDRFLNNEDIEKILGILDIIFEQQSDE